MNINEQRKNIINKKVEALVLAYRDKLTCSFLSSVESVYTDPCYKDNYVKIYRTIKDNKKEKNDTDIKKSLSNNISKWRHNNQTISKDSVIFHCLAAKISSATCNEYLSYYNHVPLKCRSAEELIYIICFDFGGNIEELYPLVAEYKANDKYVSDSYNKYPESFFDYTISSVASTTKHIKATLSDNFVPSKENCAKLLETYRKSFGCFAPMRLYIFRRILGINEKYEKGEPFIERNYSDKLDTAIKEIGQTVVLTSENAIRNFLSDTLNGKKDIPKHTLVLMILKGFSIDKINRYLLLSGYEILSDQSLNDAVFIDILKYIAENEIDNSTSEIVRYYYEAFLEQTGAYLIPFSRLSER